MPCGEMLVGGATSDDVTCKRREHDDGCLLIFSKNRFRRFCAMRCTIKDIAKSKNAVDCFGTS